MSSSVVRVEFPQHRPARKPMAQRLLLAWAALHFVVVFVLLTVLIPLEWLMHRGWRRG